MFDQYLERWRLTPDGEPVHTHSSDLLPVLRAGRPAMLKIARTDEEERGNALMAWWAGNAAASLLEHDGPALLMERALGRSSLADWARGSRDSEATRILCKVAVRLHSHAAPAPPETVPLSAWFRELVDGAASEGPLAAAASTAAELLATQRDVAVLHGDLHHGNVLDFSGGGWRAIDPKGLLGEHAFDLVNMLRNPDLKTAAAPGRLARQASVIAKEAGIERERLIRWLVAFSGLSAAWHLAEGDDPKPDLAMIEIAKAELGGL
jgi:streptomycin 6-kinase